MDNMDFIDYMCRHFRTFLMNYGIFRIFIVTITISFCGAIGGIAGGLYRYKCGKHPCINRIRDLVIFSGAGSVCAFGVIILIYGITSICNRSEVFSLGIYIIGLSLLSGFFAMRLIPILGDKLEEKVDALAKKTNIAMMKSEEGIIYNQIVSCATTALATKTQSDMEYAIKLISEHLELFRCDRTLNIYLGRLYRWCHKYDQAIISLRNFINNKLKKNENKNAADKQALAAAYFNIACYHSLKLSNGVEQERLLNEIEDALKEVICLNPQMRSLMETDTDLQLFKKERPNFFKNI